jgi:two-component system chemotaxis response regulator CheY
MARVLVVDDSLYVRQVLASVLTDMGHEVVGEAANGREAVARYRELHPDVTMMDITMPEMDGLSALRAIMTEHPTARVVMCTALKEKPTVIAALEAGARDFILKPVRPERVLEAVNKALV